jgi:hypothetical protein
LSFDVCLPRLEKWKSGDAPAGVSTGGWFLEEANIAEVARLHDRAE